MSFSKSKRSAPRKGLWVWCEYNLTEIWLHVVDRTNWKTDKLVQYKRTFDGGHATVFTEQPVSNMTYLSCPSSLSAIFTWNYSIIWNECLLPWHPDLLCTKGKPESDTSCWRLGTSHDWWRATRQEHAVFFNGEKKTTQFLISSCYHLNVWFKSIFATMSRLYYICPWIY